MAISGSGASSSDPYVVTTFTDFVSCISEYGKYVKLGNDIDVNDEFPSGLSRTYTISCREINGDNKAIKNLSYNLDSYPFQTSNSMSGRWVCKNISFTNFAIYPNNVGPSFINCLPSSSGYLFQQCKFSGVLNGTNDQSDVTNFLRGSGFFENCSFNIWLNGNSGILYSRGLGSTYDTTHSDSDYAYMYDCNVEVHGSTSRPLYMVLNNSYVTGSVESATINADAYNSSYRSIYTIIDAVANKIVGNSNRAVPYICFANKDKVQAATDIDSSFFKADNSEILDPDYLELNGLPIQTS